MTLGFVWTLKAWATLAPSALGISYIKRWWQYICDMSMLDIHMCKIVYDGRRSWPLPPVEVYGGDRWDAAKSRTEATDTRLQLLKPWDPEQTYTGLSWLEIIITTFKPTLNWPIVSVTTHRKLFSVVFRKLFKFGHYL